MGGVIEQDINDGLTKKSKKKRSKDSISPNGEVYNVQVDGRDPKKLKASNVAGDSNTDSRAGKTREKEKIMQNGSVIDATHQENDNKRKRKKEKNKVRDKGGTCSVLEAPKDVCGKSGDKVCSERKNTRKDKSRVDEQAINDQEKDTDGEFACDFEKGEEGQEKEKKKKKKKRKNDDIQSVDSGDLVDIQANGEVIDKGEAVEYKKKKKKKSKEEKKEKRKNDKLEGGDGQNREAMDKIESGEDKKKKKKKSKEEKKEKRKNDKLEGGDGQNREAMDKIESGEDKKKKKKKSKEEKKEKRKNDKLEGGDGQNRDVMDKIESGEGKKKKKKKRKECDDDSGSSLNVDGEDRKRKEKKKKKRKECDDDSGSSVNVDGEDQKRKKKKKKEGKEIVNCETDITNEATVKNCDRNAPRKKKKVTFSDKDEVFPVPESASEKKNCEIYNENGEKLIRGKRFSKEEDELIEKAVLNYVEDHQLGENGVEMVMRCSNYPELKNCWKEIGKALPLRATESVYARAHTIFQRGNNRTWTQEELDCVKKFYDKHGAKWKQLADEMGRHRVHVKDAFRRVKLSNARIGDWSQSEYQQLFDLVNRDLSMKVFQEKKSMHGMLRDNIGWETISEKLATRSTPLCCMKWYNQLSSSLVAKGEWVDTDDYRLLIALTELDASCEDDVDWDNLLEHRPGDVCRERWKQMVRHIGYHGVKPFIEQVEVLSKRYCPEILEAREEYENRPAVD